MLVYQVAGLLIVHQREVVEAEVGMRDDPVVIVQHIPKNIDEHGKEESKRVMGSGFLDQHHHSPQHIHHVIPTNAFLLQLPAEETAGLILTDHSLLPFLMIMRDIEHHSHTVRYHLVTALLQ